MVIIENAKVNDSDVMAALREALEDDWNELLAKKISYVFYKYSELCKEINYKNIYEHMKGDLEFLIELDFTTVRSIIIAFYERKIYLDVLAPLLRSMREDCGVLSAEYVDMYNDLCGSTS